MTGWAHGPSRHCAVEFRALPARIGQVRRIVAAQLRYWRLDPLIDTVALGVTELLANVHRHAGPDKHCTVEILLRQGRLTVSVRDHSPRLPTVRTAEPDEGSGRGLALIAAVSDSWGTRAREDGAGKVVWFALPVPAGAAPPRQGPSGTPAEPAPASATTAGAAGAATTETLPQDGGGGTDPAESAARERRAAPA